MYTINVRFILIDNQNPVSTQKVYFEINPSDFLEVCCLVKHLIKTKQQAEPKKQSGSSGNLFVIKFQVNFIIIYSSLQKHLEEIAKNVQ